MEEAICGVLESNELGQPNTVVMMTVILKNRNKASCSALDCVDCLLKQVLLQRVLITWPCFPHYCIYYYNYLFTFFFLSLDWKHLKYRGSVLLTFASLMTVPVRWSINISYTSGNHACQTRDGRSYSSGKVCVLQAGVLSKITAEYWKMRPLLHDSCHDCGWKAN